MAAVVRNNASTALQTFRMQDQVRDLYFEMPLLAVVLADTCRTSEVLSPLPHALQADSSQTCSQEVDEISEIDMYSPSGKVHRLDETAWHMNGARVMMMCNAKRTGMCRTGIARNGCGCVICQDPLEEAGVEKADVKCLPCGHTLHAHCLQSWIRAKRNARCPTCRGELPAELFADVGATRANRSSSLPRLRQSPATSSDANIRPRAGSRSPAASRPALVVSRRPRTSQTPTFRPNSTSRTFARPRTGVV
eukprot:TRINITY_DN6060_c0_g2_i1.p1 TRINITY_DN6060_c0_g2~~TRINITY_DN6060_c0_g2_i1.p1  ORF type:complete len:250 (-),score=15.77 TRINITY_DN6060_c0_g2_i1:304-1053(-)